MSGGFGNPSSRSAPSSRVGAAAMASGRSTLPIVKMGVPAMDVTGGKLVALHAAVLSAVRPPQPVELVPSATDVCH